MKKINDHIKDIPEQIYLQTEGIEEGDSFNDLADITWCKDRINLTDVEYVSTTLLVEKLIELRLRLNSQSVLITDASRIIFDREVKDIFNLSDDE